MHQSRGLQGVARCLPSHLVRRQLAEFIVDKREQLLGGFPVASLNRLEDTRDFDHGLSLPDSDSLLHPVPKPNPGNPLCSPAKTPGVPRLPRFEMDGAVTGVESCAA